MTTDYYLLLASVLQNLCDAFNPQSSSMYNIPSLKNLEATFSRIDNRGNPLNKQLFQEQFEKGEVGEKLRYLEMRVCAKSIGILRGEVFKGIHFKMLSSEIKISGRCDIGEATVYSYEKSIPLPENLNDIETIIFTFISEIKKMAEAVNAVLD